ncbi:GNAT family N-acetyltransferase [Bacillaceae bacterium S4-13-58]
MKIKRLGSEGAEDYWKLRLEALKGYPEAFATSYKEAVQRTNPVEQTAENLEGNYTFGAFVEEELVGVVTLNGEKYEKMNHKGHIVAMYVTPHVRNMRVGQALMKKAMEQAKELEHLEQLNLAVVTTNTPAKKLYTSVGFETYGLEKRALKVNGEYYDGEFMVLFLMRLISKRQKYI